jgi:UTP--glucose-1-phosphate uridylyltransferase
MTESPILRTALIPVAGYGTRLFPATRAVKKEFFPIVGRDGIARPALLEIVREALSASIERIVLVVQPSDLEPFQRFFNEPLPPDHYAKLTDTLKQEADALLQIGQRISFAIQPTQDGFGHAVWCARDLIREPFLLLLGDHLYSSHRTESCAAQLATVYQQRGGNVVGLHTTDGTDLRSRGAVGGEWIENQRLLSISQFAEKPSIEFARQHLRIAGMDADKYLVLFGQYILQPAVFEILDTLIRENIRERGEVQLTTALEHLRRDTGCIGVRIDGETYDIGQPDLYVQALQALRSAGV